MLGLLIDSFVTEHLQSHLCAYTFHKRKLPWTLHVPGGNRWRDLFYIYFFFCFLKFTLDMWIIYQLSSFVHNFLVESFSLKWSTVSTLPLWCIYVPTVSLINQLSYHIDGSTTAQLPRNQLLVFGHLTCLPSSFVLEIFLFILYYYW